MRPKIVVFQIILLTTLVSIQLFLENYPFATLFSITLAFVFALKSSHFMALAVILAVFSFIPEGVPPNPIQSDFELIGTVVGGPTFKSNGCRYAISSSEQRILNIFTTECTALPNDEIEAFMRPSKKSLNSGRALDLYVHPKPSFSLRREVARFRTEWINKTEALDHRGLSVALTTGNKAFLEPKTVDLFRDLGLSHLLAISGLHFGIIAAFLWYVFGALIGLFPSLILRFGKKKILAPAVIFGLYIFLIFVGVPISATRAFLMVAAYLTGLVLSRYVRPCIAVLYALCALLVYDPSHITDLGFQLSFCAVVGILCVLKNNKLKNSISLENPLKQRLASLLLVTVAAGLSTLPVLLHHTGQISWIAFPLNFFVVPFFSIVIFPALLVSAFVFRFGGPTSPIGEFFLNLITSSMLTLIEFFSFLPLLPAARSFPGEIPATTAVVMLVAIFSCLYQLDKLRIFTIFIVVLGLLGLVSISRPDKTQNLLVHFIDVGQGDSIFIQTPTGENILVDTGGAMFGSDPGQYIVAPYLKRLGIHKLDAIVITHDDKDHNGGLPAILRTINTDRVILNLENSGYLQKRGFQVFQHNDEHVSKNNRSLVLKYQHGRSCILLSGDIEEEAEQALGKAITRCSVLKLGHHGSKTSTTADFLDQLQPRFAIISAGRNNHFGHPHFSVVERLKRRGIKIFNTQTLGSIRLEMDLNGNLNIKSKGIK